MLYVISPLLAAVVIAAIIWFGSYRRKHNDQKFWRVEWAVAHHVIVLALAAWSIVILELPATMFPPYGGGILEPRSTLSLQTVIVTVFLIPLTFIVGAVVTFARNRWFQDIVLALVWLVTAWCLWQYGAAWASLMASY